MPKVLFIDDDEGIRKVFSILLRKEGYQVFTAENGEEGLKIFKQEIPPIVIADVKMPGINGIEVLKRVKEINPEAEVIIITGHGDMNSAIEALKLDASDFLPKPVKLEALSVALKRAQKKLELRRKLKEYTHNLENLVRERTEELQRAQEQIKTFYEVSRYVSENTSLKETIDFILKKIKEMVNYDYALPLIFNSKKYNFVNIEGYDSPNILGNWTQAYSIASMTEPIDMKRWRSKKLPLTGSLKKFSYISSIPIVKEKEVMGSIILASYNSGSFSAQNMRFIYLMLSQTSGVIKRIILQNEQLERLHNQIKMLSGYGDIIGKDPKMQRIYQLILDIAPSNATVLIQGESGTGKELVARAIHMNSPRKDKPFVVVNCSAYPQALIESELFGYEKGAFTGATQRKLGRFEIAHEGTIFLDEVSEIPFPSQVKILRFLQFQEFERLGGTETIKVNVRVIAATNKDLNEEVKKGNFREDLYYRLNVIPINLPPLRERKGDIPLLAEYFLKRLSTKSGKGIKELSPSAMQSLINYNWPGNVRELENVLEYAFVLTKGKVIGAKALPPALRSSDISWNKDKIASLEDNEKKFLIEMLNEFNWNKLQVAKRLGISRSTLYAKLKKYKLKAPVQK
ncbi:MAG: RNA polymerase subunit sigma-54 [Thermodesulfobacteriota bacterium]|mgnify:CR=1 FL=1|nr:MAG: RNA polymerase subunit sigma-54 [Thermodesulfobacteriota bacterium]